MLQFVLFFSGSSSLYERVSGHQLPLLLCPLVLRWAGWYVCVWKILCLIFSRSSFYWHRFCGIGSVHLRLQCTIHWLYVLSTCCICLCFQIFVRHIPMVLVAFYCSQIFRGCIGTLRRWVQHWTVKVSSRWVLFVGAVCPTVALGMYHLLLTGLLWSDFWMFVLLNFVCGCPEVRVGLRSSSLFLLSAQLMHIVQQVFCWFDYSCGC